VSGNAQQRKARFVLHHGTLLYDFDLSAIGRYLNPPEREPAYRAGRPHDSFLANLPTDANTLRQLLARQFAAEPADHPLLLADQALASVVEKYRTDEWVRRR
jgi:lipoate-protein ligase A